MSAALSGSVGSQPFLHIGMLDSPHSIAVVPPLSAPSQELTEKVGKIVLKVRRGELTPVPVAAPLAAELPKEGGDLATRQVGENLPAPAAPQTHKEEKKPIKRNKFITPEKAAKIRELIPAIRKGRITQKDAAAKCGISPGVLGNALKREQQGLELETRPGRRDQYGTSAKVAAASTALHKAASAAGNGSSFGVKYEEKDIRAQIEVGLGYTHRTSVPCWEKVVIDQTARYVHALSNPKNLHDDEFFLIELPPDCDYFLIIKEHIRVLKADEKAIRDGTAVLRNYHKSLRADTLQACYKVLENSIASFEKAYNDFKKKSVK